MLSHIRAELLSILPCSSLLELKLVSINEINSSNDSLSTLSELKLVLIDGIDSSDDSSLYFVEIGISIDQWNQF